MIYQENENEFIINKNLCPPKLLNEIERKVKASIRNVQMRDRFIELRLTTGSKVDFILSELAKEFSLTAGTVRNILYDDLQIRDFFTTKSEHFHHQK